MIEEDERGVAVMEAAWWRGVEGESDLVIVRVVTSVVVVLDVMFEAASCAATAG